MAAFWDVEVEAGGQNKGFTSKGMRTRVVVGVLLVLRWGRMWVVMRVEIRWWEMGVADDGAVRLSV